LWQVYGRSRVDFNEMVRMDLRYARACSPWLDLKILLNTPKAAFGGQGAC
jgi:lipopolysaccharide/colanic/teichoic acid biosynthesis glycosyltransferase